MITPGSAGLWAHGTTHSRVTISGRANYPIRAGRIRGARHPKSRVPNSSVRPLASRGGAVSWVHTPAWARRPRRKSSRRKGGRKRGIMRNGPNRRNVLAGSELRANLGGIGGSPPSGRVSCATGVIRRNTLPRNRLDWLVQGSLFGPWRRCWVVFPFLAPYGGIRARAFCIGRSTRA